LLLRTAPICAPQELKTLMRRSFILLTSKARVEQQSCYLVVMRQRRNLSAGTQFSGTPAKKG
jgi:hypothetical protein